MNSGYGGCVLGLCIKGRHRLLCSLDQEMDTEIVLIGETIVWILD